MFKCCGLVLEHRQVRVFSLNGSSQEVVLEIELSELQLSRTVVIKDYGTHGSAQFYVELTLYWDPDEPLSGRRPQVGTLLPFFFVKKKEKKMNVEFRETEERKWQCSGNIF